MTVLDDIIPAKVVAILSTYGADVTFTVESGKTYNPATGTVTSSAADYVVKSSPPYPYARQFINGDTVQEGDMQIIIAPPSGWTPANGQKFVLDSHTFRVVSVEPIYSGALVAAYRIQGRQ